MVFVPLGQIVGGYLETAPRGIFAYSINILVNLAGILLLTLLCQYWEPSPVRFAVAGALLVLLVGNIARLRWTTLAAFGLCLAFFYLQPHGSGASALHGVLQ